MIPAEWLQRQRERRDEVEACLLGSMLMFPRTAEQIVATLAPSRFERSAHRAVADAIWDCWRRHGTVDVGHVTDALVSAGTADEVGPTGLTDLAAAAEPRPDGPLRTLDVLDRRRLLYQAAVQTMRDVVDPTSDPDDVQAGLLARLHQRQAWQDRPPIPTGQLLTMDPPTWLVDGVIPQGVSLLFGSPKSGKSYLAVSLAWAVASGAAWYGIPTMCVPVLYLVGEGLGDIRLRSEALRQVDGEHPDDMLHWWPTSLRLSDERDQARLRLEVARVGAGLLVVDTWQRFAGVKDENDAGQTTSALSVLEDLAQDGISTVVVHHRSKAAEVSARGSSVLPAAVEAAMLVERDDDAKLTRLSPHMTRRGQGFRPFTFGWQSSGPDYVLQRKATL